MKPHFHRPAGCPQYLFAVPGRYAPKVTHHLHRLVGAGYAVKFCRLLQFFHIYVKTSLALEPVGNVFTGHFGHSAPLLKTYKKP